MAVLFFYARKFRWNEKNVCRLIYVPNKVVGKVNPKEKMLELIKKKQTGVEDLNNKPTRQKMI